MAALLFSSAVVAPIPRLQSKLSPPFHSAVLPHSNGFGVSAPLISMPAPSNLERALSGSLSSTSLSAPSSSQISRVRGRGESVSCRAVGGESPEPLDRTVYQGIYGPWTLEESDNMEVILYRSGLVAAAASFVTVASTAFLPEGSMMTDILTKNMDLLYATGAGGLGLSLFLIHIYVTPIKQFLQALWAVGVLGSMGTYLYLAKPVNESLIKYVIDHPGAVWLVGPLFASLTGLVFKEGLCYGKLEAGILTFIIPSLLLGHLSGLMDDGVKLGFLGVWMSLFVVFAARKFTQPIKASRGKQFSNDDALMVDPLEAKRLAAIQMQELQAKQRLKRQRQIEAINGSWAMIGLTAGLVIEGQTGQTILEQLAGYWTVIISLFNR